MTILEQLLTVADQDLQTTVVGGGGERSSRLQDAGCSSLKKTFFGPSGLRFGLKIRGAGAGGPGTSPRSANGGPFHTRTDQMSAGQSKNEMSSQSKLQVNERGGAGGGYATAIHLFKTNLVSRAFTSSIF